MTLLDDIHFGNPLSQWLLAALAFAVTFTVLPLLRRTLMRRAQRIAGDHHGVDLILLLIQRTRWFFLLLVALYAAGRFLELPSRLDRIADVVIVAAFWLQVALWGSAAVKHLLGRREGRVLVGLGERQSGMISVLTVIGQGAVYVVALLLALDNLGVNITTLVAGLGIGGIAVALAVQTMLGDLLASLSITLDKPFDIGDWLRVGEVEGTVEHIGIRSTRLRSLTGEQIIFSNTSLTSGRVHNLGRMPERRSLLTIGIAYDTPSEQLARVSPLVEAAVRGVAETRFEVCHFKTFGDSALQFEIIYFVTSPTDARYKFSRINDEVNRRIHAALTGAGIAFAYPTRTVILRQDRS